MVQPRWQHDADILLPDPTVGWSYFLDEGATVQYWLRCKAKHFFFLPAESTVESIIFQRQNFHQPDGKIYFSRHTGENQQKPKNRHIMRLLEVGAISSSTKPTPGITGLTRHGNHVRRPSCFLRKDATTSFCAPKTLAPAAIFKRGGSSFPLVFASSAHRHTAGRSLPSHLWYKI